MSTPDFFRARLDGMIDMKHPLAVLATRMPWGEIERSLAPLFARKARMGSMKLDADMFGPTAVVLAGGVSAAGRPRLPIRLMVALLYLKHAFNESDESLVERWAQDVLFQFFSGQDYYEHRLPCDPSQIGRFRRVLGEAGVEQLLKTTIETAVRIQAVNKSEFERVIVDSTVQEKAIAHPTDSRLLEVARGQLAELAKKLGLSPKQTFEREGGTLRRKAGGYAHAKQFKRLRKVLRRQRTILGVLMRDVQRKMDGLAEAAKGQLQDLLDRVARIHAQTASKANTSGRGKLYALHAPEVECIGKGKARRPYEFGVKSSLAITHGHGLIVGARTLPWQPLRRPHLGRTTGADQYPATGPGRQTQHGRGRPGIPRCRCRDRPGHLDPPWQVQAADGQAATMAQATPGGRARDRPRQARPRHAALLAQGI